MCWDYYFRKVLVFSILLICCISYFSFSATPKINSKPIYWTISKIDCLIRHSDSLKANGLFKENIADLRKLIPIIKLNSNQWKTKANSIFNSLAGSYGELGDYDSSLIFIKEQARWMKRYGGTYLEYGKLFHNYARILAVSNSFNKAIIANKIAILFKELKSPRNIKSSISTYRELAYCYANNKNTYLAKKYYKLCLNYTDKIEPRDFDLKFSIIEKYAELLYADGDYETIKALYSEALAFKYDNEYSSIINKIIAFQNIAELAYRPLEEYDQAFSCLDKGLSLIAKYHTEDIVNPILFKISKASLYFEEGEYFKALEIFSGCYSQIEYKPNFDLNTKLNLLYKLYKSYFKIHHYQDALAYLNLYESLLNTTSGKIQAINTDLEIDKLQLSNSIHPMISQFDSLNLIWKKEGIDLKKRINIENCVQIKNLDESLMTTGEILDSLYIQFNSTECRSARLSNIMNIIMLSDYLKSINAGDEISLKIYKRNEELIEYGVAIAYELYQQTSQNQFIDIALQLGEKNKSNQLLAAIRQAFKEEIPDIPEDLKLKEKNLTDQLRELAADKFRKDEVLTNYKSFDLLAAYKDLLDYTSTNYPDYFRNKYTVDLFKVNDFRNKVMKRNTSYISYFISRSAVFVILIQEEKEKFLCLNLNSPDTLNSILNKFLGIVSHNPKEKDELDLDNYLKYGVQLSKLLLDPIKSDLKQNIVISADGPLNYLPFDILPENLNEGKKNWSSLPYLVYKYDISYTSSFSILQELKSQKITNTKKPFLGIAYSPESGNFMHLSKLAFAEQEIKQINLNYNGELLTAKYASFLNLIKRAKNYKIVHIAAHAKADNTSGNMSYLVLAPDKENPDGIVHAYELYKYKLSNDLVVLSACETGLGENLKGEGIIGMTRAFFYAGARCVIPSLWKVSDYHMSQLLADFYKRVSNGTTLNNSLREAKITYLAKASKSYSHPFYWGGLVSIGITDEIKQNNFPWKYVLIISFCLIIALFMRKSIYQYYKSRNRNRM